LKSRNVADGKRVDLLLYDSALLLDPLIRSLDL